MYELRKYRENIEAMYQQLGGPARAAAASMNALERVPPKTTKDRPKPRSEGRGTKAVSEEAGPPGSEREQSFGGAVGDGPASHQRHHQLHISNYVPFSPQLVEVIPSMSEADDGSVHGNAATVVLASSSPASAPSSPGSEGDLQIDLSGGSVNRRRERASPLKAVQTAPAEANSIMGFRRKTHNSLQSVLDSVEVSPHPAPPPPPPPATSTPLPLHSSSVGGSGGRGGGLTGGSPGGGARGKKRRLEGVVRTLSKKLALSTEEGEGEGEEEEGEEAHPLFSSSYYEQGKTAIAEIDPEPKRPVRKVKKPGEREGDPSPKKTPRVQNSKPATPVAPPETSPVTSGSLLPPQTSLLPSSPSLTPPSSLRVEIPRTGKGKALNSAAGRVCGIRCGEWGVWYGEWGVWYGGWGMGSVVWGMGSVVWGMGNVVWGMGNGECGMGNGECGMGDGEWYGEWGVWYGGWGMWYGEWGMGSVVWGMGSVVWGMGSVVWGMGSVVWGMGNGECGMGNGVWTVVQGHVVGMYGSMFVWVYGDM